MTTASGVETRVMGAALLLTLSLFALIAYAAASLNVTVPTCLTGVPLFESGSLTEVGPGRYEAHIVARMWSFDPDTLKVPKGSTVDLYLVSADVAHGFYLPGTNVNLMALPSAVNYTRARFDKPGTFPILCHEYCGVGHPQMAMTLEVTP